MSKPSKDEDVLRPNASPAVTGRMGKVGNVVAGVNAAAGLVHEAADVFKKCAECIKTIEEQRTERTRITEKARVQVEAIQAQRELMINFMEQTFAERKQNFRDLFARLDRAMQSGNPENTRAVLDAIVEVAKTSPFAALRDAVSAHAALKDKNVTWEF